MSSEPAASGENFVRVDRRFLLFQVALDSPLLNSVMIPRSGDPSRTPDEDFRVSDPVDYDNPASELYFRKINRLGEIYPKKVADGFEKFLKTFQEALSSQDIKLRNDGGRPYTDISQFVKTTQGYTVRADSTDNQLTLILARPESLDTTVNQTTGESSPISRSSTPGRLQVNFSSDVFKFLNPQENDIIVVKTCRDQSPSPTLPFETEFIGLVTKVDKTFAYGAVDAYSLEIFGLSKEFYTSQVVSQKSINPEEFIPGVDVNRDDIPSPYATRYNDQDTAGIFKTLMSEILSCAFHDVRFSHENLPSNISGPNNIGGSIQSLFVFDPTPYVTFEQFGFQHNIFVLLAVYLMMTTNAPDAPDGSLEARLFPAQDSEKQADMLKNFIGLAEDAASIAEDVGAPKNPARFSTRPLMDQVIRGVLERGQHKTYNEMLVKGADKFFSQMVKPSDILDHIRTHAYTDVFESRDGVIVCRPPRYNKIDITVSEFERTAADSSDGNDSVKDIFVLTSEKSWEYNRNANFVIRAEELKGPLSISKNDMALECRIDVKYIAPFQGEQPFPSARYIDPDILFRYGLRMHGATSNPNAYTPELAQLFAPIALAMVNAPSRTMDIVVKDSRKFFVGKLYYIESIDMVGYLVSDTINHAYGTLSTRSLQFTMMRSVIRRPINEILGSKDEVLNFGLMYLEDFPTQTEVFDKDVRKRYDSVKNSPTIRDFIYDRAYGILQGLRSGASQPSGQPSNALPASSPTATTSSADVRVVMFKYLPNIEDMILEMDATPSLSSAPTPQQTEESFKSRQESRTGVTTDRNNQIYATIDVPGFPYDVNKYNPIIGQLKSAATAASKAEAEAQNNPTLLRFQTDFQSPEVVAGIDGYVGVFDRVIPTGKKVFVPLPVGSRVELFAMRTPFNSISLSEPPQNIVLSQPLANLLASWDLNMKFKFGPSSSIRMRPDGIQQLYFLGDSKSFSLFGSSMLPNDYLRSITGKPFFEFQEDMLNKYVGVLKFNKDTMTFENKFFSIGASDGGFKLPFGHFVFGNPTVVPSNLAFFRAESTTDPKAGGRFRVASFVAGTFSILPLDSVSQIVAEDGSKTVFTQNPSGAGELVKTSPQLYFMSPFLEPTIERLLDIYLETSLGGTLTSTQAEEQKKKSPNGSASSAKRQKGQAINVSPDALFTFSGGDIDPKPLFYERFESMLKANVGVKQSTLGSNGEQFKVQDAVTIKGKKYPVYAISIDDKDETDYAGHITVGD